MGIPYRAYRTVSYSKLRRHRTNVVKTTVFFYLLRLLFLYTFLYTISVTILSFFLCF